MVRSYSTFHKRWAGLAQPDQWAFHFSLIPVIKRKNSESIEFSRILKNNK